jgi:hypothetical protein
MADRFVQLLPAPSALLLVYAPETEHEELLLEPVAFLALMERGARQEVVAMASDGEFGGFSPADLSENFLGCLWKGEPQDHFDELAADYFKKHPPQKDKK